MPSRLMSSILLVLMKLSVTIIVASGAVFLSVPAAYAKAPGIRLWTWQAQPGLPPLIIGVKNGEDPQQAALRYLNGLKQEPELQDLFKRSPLPPMELGVLKQLEDSDFINRIALIANRPEDYEVGHWRVPSFVSPMTELGIHPYLIPFVADVGLSEPESDALVDEINSRFPPFLAMGGDDIDLRLFNKPLGSSVNYNGRRDRFELKLIARKIRTIETNEKLGFPVPFLNFGKHLERQDRLVGICRGEQAIGLSLGFDLQTDIRGHGGINDMTSGNAGNNPEFGHQARVQVIRFKPDSMLGQIALDPEQEALFYGSHHQCLLNPNGEARGEVVGTDPRDDCIEGIEAAGGAIIGIQGHAELNGRAGGAAADYGRWFMRRLLEHMTPMRDFCEFYLQN